MLEEVAFYYNRIPPTYSKTNTERGFSKNPSVETLQASLDEAIKSADGREMLREMLGSSSMLYPALFAPPYTLTAAESRRMAEKVHTRVWGDPHMTDR